jgi:hypothetical protein
VNTFSITLEKASSSQSKVSLNISPFVTYYDKSSNGRDIDKVAGAGLEIGRKLYVSKLDSASPLMGFYGSASLSYGYYSANYQRDDDSAYINTTYYGSSYYSYTSSGKIYHETIHKLGGDVFIGYQFPLRNVFYIDMFFGAGMRYGISSEEKNSFYNSSVLDIGHSGITPKIGIKMGLKI